jgi:hypothetical protein
LCLLFGLFKKRNRYKTQCTSPSNQTLCAALYVALLFVGIGEFKAAVTIAGRLIALLDITLAVGNMIMKEYSAQMPEGFKKAMGRAKQFILRLCHY